MCIFCLLLRLITFLAKVLRVFCQNYLPVSHPIPRGPLSTPQFSECFVNTAQKSYTTTGMVHTEGGWPKDIDVTEQAQTQRLIKRTERDEDYIATVARLGTVTEEVIKQNNAIDIFEQFFTDRSANYTNDVPEAKAITNFRDPHGGLRAASYLSFHHSGTRVAVAYSSLEFQKQPQGMPIESYIWDFANPSTPRETLEPSSQLCCINYNPKNENWLAGGQYNGQVAFFDLNQGGKPVNTSPIENSHKDPVYDCAWLQSKTGVELMSCSTDGEVYFWDIRRLVEPVETMPVHEKTSPDTILGASVLEYDPQAGATKFMVGTEQGTVISCNRKAKSPSDRIGTSFGSGGAGHRGPIYSLQRNPLSPKNFLTVGDWSAMIWSEDIKTPIMTTPYYKTYLTGGTWSPTRPGVFFTSKMDGSLDVWDLFHKSSTATLQVQVSPAPLTALSVQPQGKMVAIGDKMGDVHILELSESLVTMQMGEKATISALFERETKREKNLEARAREAKARARKKAAEAADAGPLGTMTDGEILDLEKEFFNSTREETQAEKDAEAEASQQAAVASDE
jgi:dynein intermediate chain 2, axonemal